MLTDTAGNSRNGRNMLFVVAAAAVLVAMVVAITVISYDDGEGPVSGAMLKYEVRVDGETSGTFVEYGVGQNYNEYFYMTKTEHGTTVDTSYLLSPKNVAAERGAKHTSSADVDTIDGRMVLSVWEYVSDEYGGVEANVRSFIDPSTGLEYLIEVRTPDKTVIYTLTEYHIEWYEPFVQSFFVGLEHEYSSAGAGPSVEVDIVCVADCDDGKYGVRYDFTLYNGISLFFLSDNHRGLPSDAENTGQVTTINTKDGLMSVEIWKCAYNGGEITFYVEPGLHMIYKFVLTGSIDCAFDLVKMPREPR